MPDFKSLSLLKGLLGQPLLGRLELLLDSEDHVAWALVTGDLLRGRGALPRRPVAVAPGCGPAFHLLAVSVACLRGQKLAVELDAAPPGAILAAF